MNDITETELAEIDGGFFPLLFIAGAFLVGVGYGLKVMGDAKADAAAELEAGQ